MTKFGNIEIIESDTTRDAEDISFYNPDTLIEQDLQDKYPDAFVRVNYVAEVSEDILLRSVEV